FPEFTVPATIEPGLYRLRVQYRWNASGSSFTPCYVGSYNETEDYMVNILPPPTCLPPSALATTNVISDSADLSWTSDGTDFDIIWGEEGFDIDDNEGTLEEGFANGGTLSGLSATTAYEFYVRQDCGGDVSQWSGPFSFTTI